MNFTKIYYIRLSLSLKRALGPSRNCYEKTIQRKLDQDRRRKETRKRYFSFPAGCVGFVTVTDRDEYRKSICLSLCLLAVLGLWGIVVKCTAAIYTQRCYCTGMNIARVPLYGFLCVSRSQGIVVKTKLNVYAAAIIFGILVRFHFLIAKSFEIANFSGNNWKLDKSMTATPFF